MVLKQKWDVVVKAKSVRWEGGAGKSVCVGGDQGQGGQLYDIAGMWSRGLDFGDGSGGARGSVVHQSLVR